MNEKLNEKLLIDVEAMTNGGGEDGVLMLGQYLSCRRNLLG
jgi:hypothetical protein